MTKIENKSCSFFTYPIHSLGGCRSSKALTDILSQFIRKSEPSVFLIKSVRIIDSKAELSVD